MGKAEPPRKKVGLALSGGAARGLAHIGVIDVLHEEGIPIDVIAGTSSGAVVGAAYARSRDINPVKEYSLGANWIKIAPLLDISLFKSGLIKGVKLQKLLATYIGKDTTFADLAVPFACVATDIDTGAEKVMQEGNVVAALRASISVPGIFTAAKVDNCYLADGGLTTPIPVAVARSLGADFVIAVNVTPDTSDRMRKHTGKEPNVFQMMLQSLYITTHSLIGVSLRQANFVIQPDLDNINAVDFQKAHEAIAQGEAATRAITGDLKKALGL